MPRKLISFDWAMKKLLRELLKMGRFFQDMASS